MIPLKTIEDLIIKHSSLEKDLSSGELDKKLFAEKSKEYSDVNEIIGIAKNYISFQVEKEELEKMLLREQRFELFNRCLNFLDTRVELDQKGFKEDIFEH